MTNLGKTLVQWAAHDPLAVTCFIFFLSDLYATVLKYIEAIS